VVASLRNANIFDVTLILYLERHVQAESKIIQPGK